MRPMRTEIVEIPNAWGWSGKHDQTAYEVRVLGQRWGVYCYLSMAWAVADRIEHADRNIELAEIPEAKP